MWNHYSRDKIYNIVDTFYQKTFLPKPVGLWLSYNDEWMKYRNSEDSEDKYYTYKITGLDELNIMKIDNYKDYVNLTDEYRWILRGCNKIDFVTMQHDYDGIMVTNYQKIKDEVILNTEMCDDILNTELRDNISKFDFFIHSLDISSCCVWNNIKKLKIELI